MKTLVAGAALGAMLLGAVPIHAQADPLTEATVQGDGNWMTVGVPNENRVQIAWQCHALASAPVKETRITCTLKLDGVEIDAIGNSSPGAATTAANVVAAAYGTLQVCWVAEITRLDDSTASSSGCKP